MKKEFLMFFKVFNIEFLETMRKRDFWLYLSYIDVKQRYRRTFLGPLWLVFSTMIFILMISIVWSTIFKQELKSYMPFFSIGYVLWNFISIQLSESCNGFIQFEYLIKQMKLPFYIFILRILTRNFIIFLHNFIAVIFVFLYFEQKLTLISLLFFVGIIILYLTLFFLSLLISIITTRFRDFQMVVQNSLPIIFYISPIMWERKLIPEKYDWLIEYNPIVPLLDIIRLPLLGQYPDTMVWIKALLLCSIIGIISLITFKLYRNKISYWI